MAKYGSQSVLKMVSHASLEYDTTIFLHMLILNILRITEKGFARF